MALPLAASFLKIPIAHIHGTLTRCLIDDHSTLFN